MIKRRRTRQIKVGNVRIGGTAPVSIQSMTKVETCDVRTVVYQIKALERLGCEIVRVAIKNFDDADAVREIRRRIKIPLVCDIHFDYRLALRCIENGADKIRLNPGNIGRKEEVAQVVNAAKKAKIPIRIGVNSGSVRKTFGPGARVHEESGAEALVRSAMGHVKLLEGMKFRDIIISLKASDVATTVEAYRRIAGLCDYPLHLGVTAAGPYDSGMVKSAIGIGALLLDGIGDTIRVSLTGDPCDEVVAARQILAALRIRSFGPEIISCPTCGRCQVNLGAVVRELERRLEVHGPASGKNIQIAVMGCEVNGPGEAREADIGIAFGKGSGLLFKKGKAIKKVTVTKAVKELLKAIK